MYKPIILTCCSQCQGEVEVASDINTWELSIKHKTGLCAHGAQKTFYTADELSAWWNGLSSKI